MFAKVLQFNAINGLIIILLLSNFIEMSDSLPKFLCLRPPFTTITKMFNKSYFVSDIEGRFWNNIEEDTVFTSYRNMINKKTKDIRYIFFDDPEHKPLPQFEATFKTNFDGKCELKQEKLFLMGRRKGQNNTLQLHFMAYSGNKWKKNKPFIPENLKEKGYETHGLLDKVIPHLDLKKRIKAVLNFPDNGLLFIQEQNLFYVYCKRTSSSSSDWGIVTKDVTKDVLVFENDYKIQFGAIFGGYVDQNSKVMYLFDGQLPADNSIVRKSVHKCDYNIEKGGTPSKIRLVCEKLVFKTYCNPPKVAKEGKQEIDWIYYGIIGASITLLVLVIILIILLYRRFCSGKVTKEEKTITPIEKRPLAINRERVLGDNKPKRGLARHRTQKF